MILKTNTIFHTLQPKNDPTAPNKISCYTCHYHIRGSYPEGMAGCDDPFRKEEIPIVECVGPCGVSNKRLRKTTKSPCGYLIGCVSFYPSVVIHVVFTFYQYACYLSGCSIMEICS